MENKGRPSKRRELKIKIMELFQEFAYPKTPMGCAEITQKLNEKGFKISRPSVYRACTELAFANQIRRIIYKTAKNGKTFQLFQL